MYYLPIAEAKVKDKNNKEDDNERDNEKNIWNYKNHIDDSDGSFCFLFAYGLR